MAQAERRSLSRTKKKLLRKQLSNAVRFSWTVIRVLIIEILLKVPHCESAQMCLIFSPNPLYWPLDGLRRMPERLKWVTLRLYRIHEVKQKGTLILWRDSSRCVHTCTPARRWSNGKWQSWWERQQQTDRWFGVEWRCFIGKGWSVRFRYRQLAAFSCLFHDWYELSPTQLMGINYPLPNISIQLHHLHF